MRLLTTKRSISTYASILFTTLLITPQVAKAHGPSPAILGHVLGETTPLTSIRLSSGLAMKGEDDAWRYMCPAAWGGPGAPLMGAGDSGLWLIGEDGPQRWSSEWSSPIELTSRDILDLTISEGQVWALINQGEASALISLDDPYEITLSESWSELISVPAGFVLASYDEPELKLLWLDHEGNTLERRSIRLSASPVRIDLRGLNESVYLEVTMSEHSVLLEAERLFEDSEALMDSGILTTPSVDLSLIEGAIRSPKPVSGPILWGDSLLILSDGELHEWSGDELSRRWPERRWTCLNDSSLCTTQSLSTLPISANELPQLIFDLTQLRGPQEDDIPVDRWSLCKSEWLDFAIHAGINPSVSSSEVGASSMQTADTGCTTQDTKRSWPALNLLSLIGLFCLLKVCLDLERGMG